MSHESMPMRKKAPYIAAALIAIPLLAAPTIMPRAEPEPEEVTAELATYDISIDYMQLMINACVSGDADAGRAAEVSRNEKRIALELEDVFPAVSWDELYLLSKIMYAEAGSSWLSDEHRSYVGNVLLNRVESPEFPLSIEDVIYQPGQYYSRTSTYFANLRPTEREVKLAVRLLEGERYMPKTVVFQANFRQGSGTWLAIPDRLLGTTYFCHSSYMGLYE